MGSLLQSLVTWLQGTNGTVEETGGENLLSSWWTGNTREEDLRRERHPGHPPVTSSNKGHLLIALNSVDESIDEYGTPGIQSSSASPASEHKRFLGDSLDVNHRQCKG